MTTTGADSSRDPAGGGTIVAAARGGGYLAAGRLYTFGLRLVTALILARLLGAGEYGILNLGLSTAFTLAAIGSLGLDSAVERYVAVQRRRKDDDGVRGSIQTGFIGTLVASTALGVGLLLAAPTVAVSVFDEPQLTPLLRVASILIPVLAMATFLSKTARGFKRMDWAALSDSFVQPTTRLALIGLFTIFGLTAYRAAWISLAAYLASIVVVTYLINRSFSLFAQRRQSRRDVKEIAAFSFPFWAAGVLSKVRKNVQTLLIGTMSTVANVGIFTLIANANLLGRIANLSIGASVRPIMAELIDEGDVDELHRLYTTATRWTLSANVPVFLVMVTLSGPIVALFGESFAAGATPLMVLAGAELTNAATGVCGAVVDMTGYNKMKLTNSIIWLTVTLVANVLLIPDHGVLGAAISVVIASVTINVVRIAEVWFIYRIVPWDRRIWKPLTAGAATMALAATATSLLGTEITAPLLVIAAVAIGAVYLGLLALLRLEPEDRLVLGHLATGLRRRALRLPRSDDDGTPPADQA